MAEDPKNRSFELQIISPDALVFQGEVESVIVKTKDGFQGFLAGRAPCCMLLAEDGEVKFRARGQKEFQKVKTQGGFCYMNKTMMIYTDQGCFVEE